MKKRIKKIIAVSLSVLMIGSSIPTYATGIDSEDINEKSLLLTEQASDEEVLETEETSNEEISGTSGNLNWSIDTDGVLEISGAGNYALDSDDGKCPKWCDYKEYVTSAVVNVKGITSTHRMFYNCDKLTNVDVSGLDTGNVTDMSYMFMGCSDVDLTSVDVSGFDTSNVTDMSHMFSNCSELTSVDVSGFDTGNVTDMSFMFNYCHDLTSIDVSGFDTSNVTDMSYMFDYCMNLTGIDVSGFNTSNVTNMSSMFYYCIDLTSIDVSKFNTSNVTDMSLMFYECRVPVSIDVSEFNTSNVTNMAGMFENCKALTSVDVSGFDTSNVTNMGSMFYDCYALTSVDVSGFDTSNVTSMACMFYCCKALTSVDVSGFDTSNVTSMASMFNGCQALTSVDVSGFDTSNVTNMASMFKGCQALTSVDVSGFDMSNVTDVSRMFGSCNNLSTCINLTMSNTAYSYCFYDAATAEQAQIYVRYSGACTEKLANAIIATKSDSSHVYTGYVISKILVDGTDVGAVTSYNFEQLSADHEIKAVFTKIKTTEKKPATPAIASIINGSSGITVKWKKVSGIDGYYLYRKAGTGKMAKIKTLSASAITYTDTSVKKNNGTLYTYTLQAYKGKTLSANASKSLYRLTSVKISSVANKAGKKIYVKWTKNTKASGYEIQYSTSSKFAKGNKTLKVKKASTITTNIKSLVKGKTYYVRVRAYKVNGKACNYSIWSNVKKIKVKK